MKTGCPAALSSATWAVKLDVARADVREHAVGAVLGRRHDRLVGDREDAAALLARGLGDELLRPQPERLERVVDDEGELVAALLGELAERDPELQARVVLLAAALLHRRARAGEHAADVVARHRGRDEPEVGEHGVAAADVGVVLEHAPEAVLGAQLRERGARVRHRDVVGAVVLQRVEVLELRHRLDRAARLRGDDEEGGAEVQGVADPADLVGVRGVEHVQADRPVAEGAPEHLRPEARAAHAEQHGVGDPGVAHLRPERPQVVDLGRQPLGDVQPAEPVGDLRRPLRGPERAVALPQAADDLLVGGGLQPFGDGRLKAGGQLALDAHGAWPYPRFYCTKASRVSP